MDFLIENKFHLAEPMAKKKDVRIVVKMKNEESPYTYYTEKSRRNNPQRMELRKYDPIVRKHVLFKESK